MLKVNVWFIVEHDLFDTSWCNKWSVDISHQVCSVFGGIRTVSFLLNTKPTKHQLRKLIKLGKIQLKV